MPPLMPPLMRRVFLDKGLCVDLRLLMCLLLPAFCSHGGSAGFTGLGADVTGAT